MSTGILQPGWISSASDPREGERTRVLLPPDASSRDTALDQQSTVGDEISFCGSDLDLQKSAAECDPSVIVSDL
ncbi:hypothetical protein CSOJ01_00731 [Colletotrichum sojae]|uniref:Uncharacterized protein n=1 Tax=Colletotrichum sojae TaxID=2175907 RepID=A0A8H6N5Q2_9PEZI|nr:hypothetical protein CSOJ01_00731 [Colletotrichum sojae]